MYIVHRTYILDQYLRSHVDSKLLLPLIGSIGLIGYTRMILINSHLDYGVLGKYISTTYASKVCRYINLNRKCLKAK
jgi:hypothetical protein